ncbi:hypothetical protein HYH02_012265 [Chlamydomonas schloesseri]|uniref:MPN domain-containing protein n=1 Tax=Chlamydomonas schloesseri TaxID=2026947 RepID=A0A835TAE2_9CHLO|nr:hypothetical protein HYH02_012265 [Chlamydomonas schloesseri]|eukprot:KAG2434435.1 hypothetical protein HYH02_012265 [Chlamydomonas schloesseri]
MAGESSTARARWELENNIAPVATSEDTDALFKYDAAEQQLAQSCKPWAKDPHHYKHVRMSALALLKIAMHARSGGNLEVMGILQGKVVGDTFIVIDSFALPVEGTETRVNAQAEAYEYMVDFLDTSKAVHRPENAVGWYHSHPGYGCWLSGIDVNTQMMNQQYQEPWLAVVVDPMRTMAAGKVEIGAFRTYPKDYKPADEGPSEYQTIPLDKIEDFGVHAKSYYPLDITFFKSSTDSHLLDLLWNKYWVATLSASPLISNREFAAGQIADVAEKLEQAESSLSHGARLGRYFEKKKPATSSSGAAGGGAGGGDDSALARICRDTSKLAAEQIKGLSTQLVKQALFNCNLSGSGAVSGAAGASSSAAPVPMET